MKIYCPFCKSEACKVHQKNGHAYSTMYRCLDCNRFFSERRFTGYSGLKLANYLDHHPRRSRDRIRKSRRRCVRTPRAR